MDKKKYAVMAKNISKCYKMYSGPKEKLMDLLLPSGKGKEFRALKNISFKIEKGEIVGLLGLNGAGKSTLSNILGGVSLPTEGQIEINGESSVIAVGLGLNNFLTGIENIEVKATMMGYKKDEIERITKEVIDFAEIGDFINQPIRTYSSGMRARLGFGIAVNMSPDILVIDEALSVGDPTFAQKCLDKMNEFKNSGKTIFFVSHSLPQVKEFCTKAMWLEYGMLKDYGDIDEILPKYEKYIKEINAMDEKEKKEYKETILKDQEHGLLAEFSYEAFNFNNLNLKGNLIKSAVVGNEKEVKEVKVNFDLATAILGFIPSIGRKMYVDGIIILIIQILNLFIMSMPSAIILNFILTTFIGTVTGKRYVKELILNRNYKVVDDLKEVNKNSNYDGKNIKVRKKQLIIAATLMTIILAGGYGTIKLISIAGNKKVVEIKNLTHIVVEKDENGKEKIDNISILNKDDNKNIKIKVYPGDLLIKSDQKNIFFNEVNYNNLEQIKLLMKNNFNEEINDYLITKEDKNIENSLDYWFSSLNNTDENRVYEESQLDKKTIENFYNEFSNANITSVEYKEKELKEILKENNIVISSDFKYKEYKLKYLGEELLKSEEFINTLKNLK